MSSNTPEPNDRWMLWMLNKANEDYRVSLLRKPDHPIEERQKLHLWKYDENETRLVYLSRHFLLLPVM